MYKNNAAFIPIFDDKTLAGWHFVPRLPIPRAPGEPGPDTTTEEYRRAAQTSGKWTVEDGAITGRQDPPGCGYGGYLLSDGVYGDFELVFEAHPDWPADTGILVRASALGSQGFQILLDHRRSGNIGGIYGNGIGGFHGIRKHPLYNAAAVRDLLSPKGHIAFEIHDNDPGMGEARWAPNAACRWRNIRICEF